MYLWGVSSLVGSGGSSGSANTQAADAAEPRAKKARKQQGPVCSAGPQSLAVTSDSASASGTKPERSAAGWMFGAGPAPSRNKKAEKCKELDVTSRVLQAFESLKASVCDANNFMSVQYFKCTSMAERLAGRSTEELMKVYRETTVADATGCNAGLAIMQRLHAANTQLMLITNFVSALHDAEATPATLQKCLDEARAEQLEFPAVAWHLCHARRCQELAAALQWEDFCRNLSPGIIESMMDESQAQVDFQVACVRSTVQTLLKREIVVKPDEKDTEGEARSPQQLEDWIF